MSLREAPSFLIGSLQRSLLLEQQNLCLKLTRNMAALIFVLVSFCSASITGAVSVYWAIAMGSSCVIMGRLKGLMCSKVYASSVLFGNPLCILPSCLHNFCSWLQILTQEDWNVVLYNGMASTSPWASLYFVALMTFGNYVLFNLLVAILVEGFQAEVSHQQC